MQLLALAELTAQGGANDDVTVDGWWLTAELRRRSLGTALPRVAAALRWSAWPRGLSAPDEGASRP